MADPADLDELDRLEKAATPGPWGQGVQRIDAGIVVDRNRRQVALASGESPMHDKRLIEAHEIQRANAAFIAAARNAMPGMIRELREARELLRSAEHGLASSEDTDEGWLSAAIPLIGDIRAHLDKHTKKETTDAE